MKDQYFGDVSDYRKYGLLRGLVGHSRMNLGVCWLLTAPDKRPDGEFRVYLERPQRWRRFDPDLYDRLTSLRDPGVERNVALAPKWEMLPGARYHDQLLTDGIEARRQYFANADEALKGSDLWFFDPDNGLEVKSVGYGNKGSHKYLYLSEVASAFQKGRSLIIYQHYPRVSRTTFTRETCERLQSAILSPAVIPIHTAHVLFLIVAQPHHEESLRQATVAVANQWPEQLVLG